jgi:hypothetical protein
VGRLNNLKSGKLAPLKSRVRRTETTNALDSGSVDNGTTTYRGNESLKIVGSALVSGWLIITGTLKLVGNFLMEGAATFTGTLTAAGAALFTGALTSRGTTRFEGDTSQIGPLHVVGDADVNGNFTVLNSGRIRVGTLTGAFGGALTSPNSIDIIAPSVNVSTNFYAGGTIIANSTLTASASARVTTTLINTGIATQTLASNVFVDTVGRFWKVTSAKRFKIDPKKSQLDRALLDVPVVSWIDAGAAERYAELLDSPRPFTEDQQFEFDTPNTFHRVPGVIAEEVLAAGGREFISYNAYDRLALGRTEILADVVDELRREIADLRDELRNHKRA